MQNESLSGLISSAQLYCLAELYPDYVARFYDAIYASLRTVDREYYLRKIEESKGPVLEIGGGTGRFFLEALNCRADIYTIEPSESMFHVLINHLKPEDRHRATIQSAESFRFGQKFNLIIAPFRMFSHLITTEQQLQALNQIHHHLSEGGLFIFDLFVPNLKMLTEGIDEQTDFDGEYVPGQRLRRIVSAKADIMNQVNHVTMRYEWEENGKQQSHAWHFPMRYFFRWEIEHLIARSPLKLESIFGDFDEHELSQDSKDFVVLCRKT